MQAVNYLAARLAKVACPRQSHLSLNHCPSCQHCCAVTCGYDGQGCGQIQCCRCCMGLGYLDILFGDVDMRFGSSEVGLGFFELVLGFFERGLSCSELGVESSFVQFFELLVFDDGQDEASP